MTVEWVITQYGNPLHIDKLVKAVEDCGLVAHIVNIGDVFRETTPVHTNRDCDKAFIFTSVIRGCQHVFGANLLPTWFDQKQVTNSKYYAHWTDKVANFPFAQMPLNAFFDSSPFWFNTFGKRAQGYACHMPYEGNAVFVRPDSNCKEFTGQLVFENQIEWFRSQMELLDMDVNAETLITVCSPIQMFAEYRLLMNRGKYVTGSRYHKFHSLDKHPAVPHKVIQFAETIEPYPGLPPVYMLDVALTSKGCKVIEVGSVHCAGLYEMDHVKFVQCLTQEAELWLLEHHEW